MSAILVWLLSVKGAAIAAGVAGVVAFLGRIAWAFRRARLTGRDDVRREVTESDAAEYHRQAEELGKPPKSHGEVVDMMRRGKR